jgi:FkbM family methyltransferase
MLKPNSSVYVFGGGTFGIDAAGFLAEYGINVEGILDNAKTGTLGKWNVTHPSSADSNITVILGVCNLAVDLNLVAEDLRRYGFTEFVTPVELYRFLELQGLDKDHYWLTTKSGLYLECKAKIQSFYNLLIDEESRSLLDKLIKYRTEGKMEDLPEVHPVSHQYLPFDLNVVPSPLHLADCGAFVGEILDFAHERNFVVTTYYGFEPDPINFEKLVLRVKALPETIPGTVFPLGVAEKSKQVRFSADGTLGAAISTHGETVIQVASLDEVLVNQPINYIKMDIEGAEMDALVGSLSILKKNKPNLAISIYHKPDDLWEIGLWLDELNLGYKFAIRQYGHQCFDTVLYAF